MASLSSKQLREEGNALYTKASAAGLAPVLRASHLKRALRLYSQAQNAAPDRAQWGAAAKNAGLAGLALSELSEDQLGAQDIEYHLIEGFKSLTAAARTHKSQPAGWGTKLDDLLVRRLSGVIQGDGQEALEERAETPRLWREPASSTVLGKLCRVLEPGPLSAMVQSQIARLIFAEGVSAYDESKDRFRESLSLMRECYNPLMLSLQTGSEGQRVEAEELFAEVHFQTCIYEACQLRTAAKSEIDKALYANEELDMRCIHIAMDLLKEAEQLARGAADIEGEAMAKSALGQLYSDVLKVKPKARRYYSEAFALCQSLWPRTFNTETWYQGMAESLKRFQKEAAEEEDEKVMKEKGPHLEALKGDLDKTRKSFDRASGGSIPNGFEYLYKHHPPKPNSTGAIPKCPEVDDNEKYKQALLKGILHYHPDRNGAGPHGMRWAVFAEEVTKILTGKYELFKL